jgi:hypothetical protein
MPTVDDATIVGAAAQQRSLVTEAADARLVRPVHRARVLSGGLIVRPAGQRMPTGRTEIREKTPNALIGRTAHVML